MVTAQRYRILGLFLVCFLYFVFTPNVFAATLSLSPGTGVYTAGSSFTARVLVNTGADSINAAEGSLKFDPSVLQVVSLTKGSVFSLWAVDPTYSNSAGTISFGGGSPAGYKGSAGVVLSVTFRAKAAGTGKVTFNSGSVLAADGRGTNVLTSMNSGSYTIAAAEVPAEPEVIEYVAPPNTPAAPSVTSQTHSSDGWSKLKEAQLTWNLPGSVTAVRTLLDTNSGSIPTKVYEPPIGSITLNDLEEGVQYFHIQFKNQDGWGRVAHYRLAVDSVAPTSFTIDDPESFDQTQPEQSFALVVADAASGPAYYMVQVDGGEPYRFEAEAATSTLTLAALKPGQHSLVIEAFDHAGNSLIATRSFVIAAFDQPVFTEYPNELSESVIPVIKGMTRPGSEVTVTLTRQGAEPVSYSVTADTNGEFIFIPDGRLSLGVYELQAVATDTYGAQSDPSETIRIAVQQPGYMRIGNIMINIMSIVVPLVALVALLLIVTWYARHRYRILKRGVLKEAGEAVVVVDAEFSLLAKELEKQLEMLRASRKTKKLTKGESTLAASLKKSLESSQERINKEITDVDKVVTK